MAGGGGVFRLKLCILLARLRSFRWQIRVAVAKVTNSGPASANMVIASPPGAAMAATKAIRNTVMRQCFRITLALSTPTMFSPTISTGASIARPKAISRRKTNGR